MIPIDQWVEDEFPGLREDLRSTLAIHVDNKIDVPRILNLILISLKERTGE